ncbi:MAG: DUF3090 family protein, partial [Acidimicrobiales bacterium]
MSASFEPGPVDHITVGTVGRPGQRVFFLQVRTAGQTVSFKLEKGQVAALSVAFSQLLSDLPPTGPLPTDLELVEPVEPTWVIGAIGLSPYDDRTERLTLMAEEAVPDGEPDGHTA